MAFFILTPFYWLASIMLYAASPRQQINPNKKCALIPKYIAWACFSVINIASLGWMLIYDWPVIVVSLSLLLMNMLIVPSCIILVAHKPNNLKLFTVFICFISVIAQLISQG